MRADRLVATLLLLQVRGRVTAAELASELEVSLATARRDLEALSTAGLPVYAQPGRGGGWRLLGGARTDLSGLSADEARALFLLVGASGAGDPAVRSALRKLLRALPGPFRDDAVRAAAAVLVDPAAWGAQAPDRPELASVLVDAVLRRRRVQLTYRPRTGEPSTRQVDPWGLVDKDGIWYLLAGVADGHRSFRLDRVLEARITEDAARPPPADLSDVWSRVVAEVEQHRAATTATVRTAARHLPILRTQFGRAYELLEDLGPDRVVVRLAAPTPLMIAQQLAGWGAAVQVVEPEEVRFELARLGAELMAAYRPAAP